MNFVEDVRSAGHLNLLQGKNVQYLEGVGLCVSCFPFFFELKFFFLLTCVGISANL